MIGKTMIGLGLFWSICFISVHFSVAAENAPHEISGFRLGSSIDDYEHVSDHNFLKEVVVGATRGFRKGVIFYGVCERPGEIVKIKLKYKDASRKFYEQLLQRYIQKFGKADEFTGDAFGIIKAWKWRFKDQDNNRITLMLQNNLKNMDENIGNMVKLSMPDRIEAERQCFNRTIPKHKKMTGAAAKTRNINWNRLLPR